MAVADFPTTHTAPEADDTRVSLRRVIALQRIGEQIAQATTDHQVFEIAAAGLTADAGYVNAWIATVDMQAGTFHGRAASGAGMQNPLLTKVVPLARVPEHRSEARSLLEDLAKRDLIASPEGYAALAMLRSQSGDADGQKLALKRCEAMAKSQDACLIRS